MNIEQKSIEEWIRLTRGNGEVLRIPISLHTTSGSMEPFIRIDDDTVTVVPCVIGEISVGDVVLVRNSMSEAGVILHRVYSVGKGKIRTIGDRRIIPDEETDATDLLGRAVSVTGPGKNIDCSSPKSRIQGKLIAGTHWARPFIFRGRRAVGKLLRIARSLNTLL